MDTFTTLHSPIGELLLTARDGALTALHVGDRHAPPAGHVRDDATLAPACAQLAEYFAGARTAFALPLAAAGTPFEQRVWAELARIPFGETTTYGEIARRIGRPGAARAVGRANARNPIAVVVPCHRVIGSDGALTGYAGGVARKRALLALEGAIAG